MSDAKRAFAARQHYETGVALHRQDKLAEAEQHYLKVRQAYPDHPGVLHGLGLICLRTQRLEDAAAFLQRASTMAPQDAAIGCDLGKAWLKLGQHEDAARCFQGLVAAHPAHLAAWIGLGDALSILGRSVEARRAFETILTLNPRHAAGHFGLGTILMQLGRPTDARRAFEEAVALAPKHPAYHRALAEAGPFGESDPRLAALEMLAREEQDFADEQKVELHFALSKAYDDLRRYGEAFEHLQLGNGIRRRSVSYDEAAVMQFFADLAAVFTPALLQTKRGTGHASEMPVFVVGMPRSGTTLVEQILASHPAVFGAGELTFVGALVAEGRAGAAYPSNVASLPQEAFSRFGASYVSQLVALAPGAKRIVDKLPANFRQLGLIHLALPNARVIHVHRDPMDTCFSCYSKLFLGGLNYTYELGELGRYCKAYERLMAHWRAVLPQGTMLEVQYEDLTRDFVNQAKRIVAFCGLEWDARCLEFHRTERSVRTLSQAQVRQPLFKSSIGRWRHYEQWLQPLRDVLQ
jgi:tetratricopeptide (TPR) repeat protein